jgi:hypothetical protein
MAVAVSAVLSVTSPSLAITVICETAGKITLENNPGPDQQKHWLSVHVRNIFDKICKQTEIALINQPGMTYITSSDV